ncbi:MAG: carbohydrate ABC transporter permease [Chloroflexi bacterium]|nr:carbohydrate ABC transporter permease [Chloroflexota bacterium]
MRNISVFRQIITQLILLLVGLFILIPVWSTVRLAFDGSLRGRPTEFTWLPKEFSTEAFTKVLDRPYQSVEFNVLLRNSMIVSIGAAILAILLGISLAYGFARFRFPTKNTGLFVLLLAALLPPIAFATPLYIILSLLKIRTTLIGLVIVYAAFAMPFAVWNMRAAFQAIPKEIEEAAYLDGANHFQTFLNISLPISMPSIAVTAMIAFLMGYTEFAIGWLFVDKADNVTLSMATYALVNGQFSGAQPWSYLGSLAIIMSIPVMVVFIFFQETLMERLLFQETS